jgi:hypothetical protein
MAFRGDFTPVLAKHSKSFDLIDAISIGVDKAQRNFEPLQQTVNDWKAHDLSASRAKLIIYEAFVEGKLQVVPKLMKTVHQHYFDPQYDEFKAATLWSLSNAFTSSFKELKLFQQFRATAKLSSFLSRFSPS